MQFSPGRLCFPGPDTSLIPFLHRAMTAYPHLALETPNQAEVIALIAELDAYQKPLYPAGSHHGIDIAALAAANVLFAVARADGGEVVACGAMVLQAEYGELKRMFTRPAQRGRGVASALLAYLEAAATARGCLQFMLETGNLQPQALALYARHGYQRCGPFGDYADDPHSVFMMKTVT